MTYRVWYMIGDVAFSKDVSGVVRVEAIGGVLVLYGETIPPIGGRQMLFAIGSNNLLGCEIIEGRIAPEER